MANRKEYSLKRPMMKLKLQYFGHLMQRADSLEKIWMLGKTEGKKRREQQRISWLDSITNSKDMHLSQFWEIVKDRGSRSAAVHGLQRVIHDLATEQQQIITPICSSKSSFTFPKNYICSPKRPPLPLLRCYFSLNSKLPQGVTHFSMANSYVYVRYLC